MTKIIAVLTGSTGFLGQRFVSLLEGFGRDKYSDIILVGRAHKCISIHGGEPFDLTNFPEGEKHLFHFATLYNPKPILLPEIEAIFGSNVLFPMELMKALPNISKVYCMQSYQELLPIHFQNEYSLSKSFFTKSLDSCGISAHKFYLFDNFGTGDTRGKVVDIFIEKALTGVDIEIPSNEVRLNLCEASNVVKNIFELIDGDSDRHLIGNKEQISLSDLAKFIIYETKSRSKINLNGTSPDPLKFVEGEITNLTGYDNESLYEDLGEHIYNKRTATVERGIQKI